MLDYNPKLKPNARRLRSAMTDAEQKLWSRLRRKQFCNVQFYRQKPLGNFIADFYAPAAALVIEIDGSQHFEVEHAERDKRRDAYFNEPGLRVLRFNNLQVLRELDAVLEEIYRIVVGRVSENPP